MTQLPTLRGHVLWAICKTCRHVVKADQWALIAAGRGDVPIIKAQFRCDMF